MARPADPRIVDPYTHPQKWVTFTVAAEYLGMSRRVLNEYAEEGKIHSEPRGKRPKISIAEILRFEGWLRQKAS